MKRNSGSIYAGLDYVAFLLLLEHKPTTRVGKLLHRNKNFRPKELQVLKSLVPADKTLQFKDVLVWHDTFGKAGIISVFEESSLDHGVLCVIYHGNAAVYAEDPDRASTSRRFIRRVLRTLIDVMVGGCA
jgi:hypothetical protein